MAEESKRATVAAVMKSVKEEVFAESIASTAQRPRFLSEILDFRYDAISGWQGAELRNAARPGDC